MSKKITKKDAEKFFKYMSKKYKTEYFDKGEKPPVKLLAEVIDKMGVIKADDFMKKFSMTIGRRIYLPFKPGAAKPSPWSQIKTCVHEHQHVMQYRKNPFKHVMRYVLSSAKRAVLEAEAYRTAMELDWWRYRRWVPVTKYTDLLKYYGCNKADRRVAEKHLKISQGIVKRGKVISKVSRNAIAWLDKHCA